MKKSSSNNAIVLINQSSGYLMIDIVNAYVSKYDNVILFTGFLNPRKTQLDPKVKVHFLNSYNRKNSITRLFTWGIFFIQSFFLLCFKYRKTNLFLVTNPPLNILFGILFNRNITHLVYDVYPDALVSTGMLSEDNWLVAKWVNWNRNAYKKSIGIFTIGQGMKNLLSKYTREEKIKVVPVWSDNDFIKPIAKNENPLTKEWRLENKFVVMYSGNIGLTHPVERLLDLADLTKDLPIEYIIIGEGEKKKTLQSIKEEKNLSNVRLLPYQPTELLPFSLTVADLAVVTLSDEAGQLSVPSKTYGIMSAGKPIIAIAPKDSELNLLIQEYKIGELFEASSLVEMKNFIENLMQNKELYDFYSKNSLEASQSFTPDNAIKLLDHV